MIGKTQKVLVENEQNNFYNSKTQCGKVAKIKKSNNSVNVGQFVDVIIEDYKNGNLYASIKGE